MPAWNIMHHCITHLWQHPHIRKLTYICGITTTLSAGILTSVAAIMQGFEYYTHKQLQSVHPDLTVTLPTSIYDYDTVTSRLYEATDGITATSPYAYNYALLYHPRAERFHAVTCYSIDPALEAQTTQLPRMTTEPEATPFEEIVTSPGILIGKPLARKLHAKIGDTLYIGHQSSEGETTQLSYTSVTVRGLYSTGIEEQDMYHAYISHETYEDVWEHVPITHIGIRCQEGTDLPSLASRIEHAMPYIKIRTWHTAYPALTSALQLEKYAMLAIFTLLVMLASISTVTLLYLIIYTKSRDCAVLYIMGATSKQITYYMFMITFCSVTCASISGVILGGSVSWIIDAYHLVPLPSVYHIHHLPARITPTLVAGILGIIVCINAVATWIPCRSLHTLNIARILKGHA